MRHVIFVKSEAVTEVIETLEVYTDAEVEKAFRLRAKEYIDPDCNDAIAMLVHRGTSDNDALLMVKGQAFDEDIVNDGEYYIFFADIPICE